MLRTAYDAGRHAALQKFALEAPSPADRLVASVESGKDAPPPENPGPVLPQDPAAALGDPNGAMPAAPPVG